MLYPQAVRDLLHSLQIGGLHDRVEPGQRLELAISPPVTAFESLVGALPLTNFTLDLDEIDLPGLDVEPLKTVGIDLGTLAPNVPVDLGTLAPNLVTDAGTLAPNLVADVGTLSPDLDADLNADGAPASSELDVVLEDVELRPPPTSQPITAANVDTEQAAERTLPYLLPTAATPLYELGTKVRGLLGKIKGSVQQIQSLIGEITGTITQQSPGSVTGTISQQVPGSLSGNVTQQVPGSLTGTIAQQAPGKLDLPALQQKAGGKLGSIVGAFGQTVLTQAPTVSVRWLVRDDAGHDLAAGTDFLVSPHPVPVGPDGTPNDPLTQLAPSIVFLPELVEFTGSDPALAPRQISCEVTLTGPDDMEESWTIGPVKFVVPQVPIPSLLVMSEHAEGDERGSGRVLVAVPGASPFWDLTGVTDRLAGIRQTLQLVVSSIPGLGDVDDVVALYGSHIAVLDRLTPLIDNLVVPRLASSGQITCRTCSERATGNVSGSF